MDDAQLALVLQQAFPLEPKVAAAQEIIPELTLWRPSLGPTRGNTRMLLLLAPLVQQKTTLPLP